MATKCKTKSKKVSLPEKLYLSYETDDEDMNKDSYFELTRLDKVSVRSDVAEYVLSKYGKATTTVEFSE